MVKKCIILGELKKTLCLPFIFAVVQIGHKMFNRFFYREIRPNLILNYYVTSFAMMTIIFLPCILKIKYIETDKERKIQKKKFLHYTLLAFIFIVYVTMKTIPPILKGTFASEQKRQLILFLKDHFYYWV